MQKFQFKLNGLLKVREFKEKRIKIELGEVLKEITTVEETIAKLHRDIDETYKAQEDLMKDPAAGKMIQFFPYFIQGKQEDIKLKENMLYALRKKYERKVQELAEARGEVKVLENFKDKKKTEWRKEYDKKIQEDMEEFVMLRQNMKKDNY